MRRVTVPVLFLLNLGALGVLVALHAPIGHGAPDSVSVDELRYGAVDIDGINGYTGGDAMVFEWIWHNDFSCLEEAVKVAKRNPDGGIDLSPYFRSFKPRQVAASTDAAASPDASVGE